MDALENLLQDFENATEFREEEIPHEKIIKIIEAGFKAPIFSRFAMPFVFIITNKDVIRAMNRSIAYASYTDPSPFRGAPVVLAVLADQSRRNGYENAVLTIGNIINAARALGLNARLKCTDNHACKVECKTLLKKAKIKKDYSWVAFVALGFPPIDNSTNDQTDEDDPDDVPFGGEIFWPYQFFLVDQNLPPPDHTQPETVPVREDIDDVPF